MRIATVTRRPTGNVVKVGQHLRIWHFADQVAEKRRDITVIIRIALAEIELWCNGQIPFQSQSTAEVANMFVNAKNLLNHNHDRQRAVSGFWPCVVSRHIIALRGNGGFTGQDRFFRGGDDGRSKRGGGRRKIGFLSHGILRTRKCI